MKETEVYLERGDFVFQTDINSEVDEKLEKLREWADNKTPLTMKCSFYTKRTLLDKIKDWFFIKFG